MSSLRLAAAARALVFDGQMCRRRPGIGDCCCIGRASGSHQVKLQDSASVDSQSQRVRIAIEGALLHAHASWHTRMRILQNSLDVPETYVLSWCRVDLQPDPSTPPGHEEVQFQLLQRDFDVKSCQGGHCSISRTLCSGFYRHTFASGVFPFDFAASLEHVTELNVLRVRQILPNTIICQSWVDGSPYRLN